MTQKESKEVLEALNAILDVRVNTIVVSNKEAAETFSQIILDATNNETGVITGPYGESGKIWHVEK